MRADAAVIFHLVLPAAAALFALYGAWQERTHLLQDLVARFAVLFAVASVAVALEQSYPDSAADVAGGDPLAVLAWRSG